MAMLCLLYCVVLYKSNGSDFCDSQSAAKSGHYKRQRSLMEVNINNGMEE